MMAGISAENLANKLWGSTNRLGTELWRLRRRLFFIFPAAESHDAALVHAHGRLFETDLFTMSSAASQASPVSRSGAEPGRDRHFHDRWEKAKARWRTSQFGNSSGLLHGKLVRRGRLGARALYGAADLRP